MQKQFVTLEHDNFRLRLIPDLGGSIASWDRRTLEGWIPLFRPWNEKKEDLYTVACFPLVPWSNRITQGGFEFQGTFYPVQQNRDDEAYPIHGDGWLQKWKVSRQEKDLIELSLTSASFPENPYHYSATQTFRLVPDGLSIELTATHLGETPLPYGLGLHPYFTRNSSTRLRFKSSGVWLAGNDPIPVGYTTQLPDTFDYNQPSLLEGQLIDHCFNGWDGKAEIDYPDSEIMLTMLMENSPGYTLMYRPPSLDYFCLEPITQPIDAFHMEGMPGLAILSKNQSFSLHTSFMVTQTDADKRSFPA